MEGYNYMEFDFSNSDFHEIQHIGQPTSMYFKTGTITDLVMKLTDFIGRPPLLPEWTQDGAILGVQGGTDKVGNIRQD